MEPTIATIHRCLGTLVFGEAEDTLPSVVLKLLEQQNLSLATAEGATAGLLAHWLAGTVHHGTYRGGLVTGSQVAAGGALDESGADRGKDADTLRQTVLLASQARRHFRSDLGLAVSPAPRGTQTPDNSGEIHCAVVMGCETVTSSSAYAAHPAIQREVAAKKTLDLARHWLLDRAGKTNR